MVCGTMRVIEDTRCPLESCYVKFWLVEKKVSRWFIQSKGALSSEDGGGGEKVAQKVIQRSFNLLRDHFNSLTFV